ncbi:hypothetical protein B296_00019863 [Ensete ventricosum]|uniref:Uncharacterized protein n=1 Tax=Ensete ventricosum TaxID=4639 RepID=A0A426ZI73_ENSVE|nr:hypothetical protein B296_00019863 [Ensete ventricosum]
MNDEPKPNLSIHALLSLTGRGRAGGRRHPTPGQVSHEVARRTSPTSSPLVTSETRIENRGEKAGAKKSGGSIHDFSDSQFGMPINNDLIDMVRGGLGSYKLRMNGSEVKAEIHTLHDGGLLMQAITLFFFSCM